jgi:hypothetical protein
VKKALLAGALTLVSIEAHALAEGPGCAVVKHAPDGFLNLREAFSPGDRLYVVVTKLGITTNGDWSEIHGVWDGNDASKPWHSGWVARRFIRQIKCPKEMEDGNPRQW